jgi:hypothetical protein
MSWTVQFSLLFIMCTIQFGHKTDNISLSHMTPFVSSFSHDLILVGYSHYYDPIIPVTYCPSDAHFSCDTIVLVLYVSQAY